MENDKRRYKRFAIDFMKINGKMMFTSNVDIIDISVGGICLKADRRLNIGGEYLLKIQGKGNPIAVKAVVVWSSLQQTRKSPNGDLTPLYTVGMQYTDFSNDKIAELVAFIDAHSQEDQLSGKVHELSDKRPDMRFSMRFQITTSGKTILTCPEPYKLKKVSNGGMLIESSSPLASEQRLPMNVSLPGDIELSFLGRVASCIPITDIHPGRYAIGIEFVDMPKHDSEKLNEFILRLDTLDEPR